MPLRLTSRGSESANLQGASRLVNALAAVIESDPSRDRLVHPNPNQRRKAMTVTMVGQRPLDLHSTVDGAVGLVETGEDAIADVVDLFASMPSDQASKRLVVPAHHLIPRFVPHGLDQFGRLHDVGEHERARLQMPGGRLCLVVACVGEQLGDVALVQHRAEPREGCMGRAQFQYAALRVAACLIGATQRHPCPGFLVGCLDFTPQCERLAEISHGALGIALREGNACARG